MNTRIAQASRLVADFRLTEMDDSGLSADEQVAGLIRELGVSKEQARQLRDDWASSPRTQDGTGLRCEGSARQP